MIRWKSQPLLLALLLALLLHGLLLVMLEAASSVTQETRLQQAYHQATVIHLEAPAQLQARIQAVAAVQTKEADPPPASASFLARQREIERLETAYARQRQALAERPRVHRISRGRPLSSEEALYLQQWEERVEHLGNLNYPEDARQQGLTGRLRLVVAINADGSIREAQLLTSSGHPLLDTAALRILKLAAPFAPLPEALLEKADVLEIVRTWRFSQRWQ